MPTLKEQLDTVYLVQHVNVRKLGPGEELKKGIDGYFTFAYMGAAEFEFGALPGALKVMRSSKICKKPIEITSEIGKSSCWYVGTEERAETARLFFEDQLKPSEDRVVRRLKEQTSIRRNFLGKAEYRENNLRGDESRGFPKPTDSDCFDGWWSIDHSPFLLFRQKEHAALWLKNL